MKIPGFLCSLIEQETRSPDGGNVMVPDASANYSIKLRRFVREQILFEKPKCLSSKTISGNNLYVGSHLEKRKIKGIDANTYTSFLNCWFALNFTTQIVINQYFNIKYR